MNKIILSEQNIGVKGSVNRLKRFCKFEKFNSRILTKKDAQIIEYSSILCASKTLKPSLKQN